MGVWNLIVPGMSTQREPHGSTQYLWKNNCNQQIPNSHKIFSCHRWIHNKRTISVNMDYLEMLVEIQEQTKKNISGRNKFHYWWWRQSCPTDCPLSPTYKPHPPKRQSNSFPIATQCVRQKKHQCSECNCMLRWTNIEKHLRKVHSKNSWDKSIYGQKESYYQWTFQGAKNKKHIAKKGAKLKNKQFAFAEECCWNPIFNPRSLRRQQFHT